MTLDEQEALTMYWEEKMYGQTKRAILCPAHRNQLVSRFPNARGDGKYVAVSLCERCDRV
jgi:hypothetical protein